MIGSLPLNLILLIFLIFYGVRSQRKDLKVYFIFFIFIFCGKSCEEMSNKGKDVLSPMWFDIHYIQKIFNITYLPLRPSIR